MIAPSVCTAAGIVPVEGAEVTVTYTPPTFICDGGTLTGLTDGKGNAGIFKLPVKRTVIGGRKIDFPRRAECNIEIRAEGFVPLKVRGIHLFPGITVVGRFNLTPQKDS